MFNWKGNSIGLAVGHAEYIKVLSVCLIMQETSNNPSLLSGGVKSPEGQMLVNRLACLDCSMVFL